MCILRLPDITSIRFCHNSNVTMNSPAPRLLRSISFCVVILFTTLSSAHAQKSIPSAAKQWTNAFGVAQRTFASRGANPYFTLEPGAQSTFVAVERSDTTRLVITVLDKTESIGNIETRVVEERESVNGNLKEISRNFFALCTRTNTLFYFGEEVDMYEKGKVVSHDGAWRAGKDGASAGVMLPGLLLLGSRYYQEIAPKVAMDRAEIVAIDETVTTPSGTYRHCIKIEETTPLEPKAVEYKYYAPGVGLVKDGDLLLVNRRVK